MELNRSKAVVLVLLLFIMGANHSYGQTFSEWFSQKKTQKKYLVQQIVALELYSGYLKKGYNIASNGLETVRSFTNGEFSLHHTFISSLKAVSPAVRNNVLATEIIALQLSISKAFSGIRNNGMLNLSHQRYVQHVKGQVMEECGKDLEELLLVITSGKVEMTDDQRIERLEKVYRAMQDKSAFTQSFCNQVGLLIQQKTKEQESIIQLKNSYGIIN